MLNHVVPAKTLSFVLPLFVEMVTTRPDGEAIVISRSPGKVCVMLALNDTFPMYVPAILAVTVLVKTLGGAVDGIICTVLLVKVWVSTTVGAKGRVVTAIDHEFSAPPLVLASSDMVSVHVPFGFSPIKAANASSGASGDAVVKFTYV